MEIAVGTRIPAWTLEPVDAGHMKTMALLLRDPNPIHWDVAVTRRLGMGDRPVNQGPSNAGYLVNMLLAWLGDPAAIRGFTVRFLGNVLAGDRVEAGGVVTALREGDPGLATCEVWLDRGDGTRVASGTAEVVVPPGSAGGPPAA